MENEFDVDVVGVIVTPVVLSQVLGNVGAAPPNAIFAVLSDAPLDTLPAISIVLKYMTLLPI
jgi:hypothetical protein